MMTILEIVMLFKCCLMLMFDVGDDFTSVAGGAGGGEYTTGS